MGTGIEPVEGRGRGLGSGPSMVSGRAAPSSRSRSAPAAPTSRPARRSSRRPRARPLRGAHVRAPGGGRHARSPARDLPGRPRIQRRDPLPDRRPLRRAARLYADPRRSASASSAAASSSRRRRASRARSARSRRSGFPPPLREPPSGGLASKTAAASRSSTPARRQATRTSLSMPPPRGAVAPLRREPRAPATTCTRTATRSLEWDRLGRAGHRSTCARWLGAGAPAAGGSTLATQIEKFRHSPGGLTESPLEKLRQIACGEPARLPARAATARGRAASSSSTT